MQEALLNAADECQTLQRHPLSSWNTVADVRFATGFCAGLMFLACAQWFSSSSEPSRFSSSSETSHSKDVVSMVLSSLPYANIQPDSNIPLALAESQPRYSADESKDSLGKSVESIFYKTFKSSPLQYDHRDSATLGKPTHLAPPSQRSLRPSLSLRTSEGFRYLSHSIPGELGVCFADSYGMQLRYHDQAAMKISRSVMRRHPRFMVKAGRDGSHPESDEPPELKGDPRDFRARLVAAQRPQAWGPMPGESNTSANGWMYETTLLEQGSVLLGATVRAFGGFALKQQYFHKCVILLLKHDDHGTKGIILNRPTGLQLDGWQVWFGGDCAHGGMFRPNYLLSAPLPHAPAQHAQQVVTCLHRIRNEKIQAMSTRIVKEIYQIPFQMAKALVELGQAKREDFWVFVGYAGWGPGQLQDELERQSWYLAAADGTLVVDELLSQASDPSSLPRVDADAGGLLLTGGDGLRTWERLAKNIGKQVDTKEDFADTMLREWVRDYLTVEGQRWPKLPPNLKISIGALSSETGSQVDVGTVLVSSSAQPFLLEKQYLHKAVIIVVKKTEEMIIAAVLNRPRMRVAAINLPGQGPSREHEVGISRRVWFGGELGGNTHILPLHHKSELGGAELGNSGVFMANNQFIGKASDLMFVSGLLAWAPPMDLQRQIEAGTFTIVPSGKVPWEAIWKLAEVSAMNSNSLEERIADVKRSEESDVGEIEVLRDRAVRVAKRSCEAWDFVISQTGSAIPKMSESERRLGDEALFEWCKEFTT
eukprot:gnl/TRDRNA2_/TRDRNA2_162726_c0_seq2.p1 gnl/TRDRNA2_/TRDRNA2_162726_c0~~gnl/TRDRNA2_/TRDRNA2_162726_c0_seq2.p1  ORF type:complete len:765 (-),score=82.53 gnl/TRDRNA2_/TRDRNA2_162726_c0_seq2:124-2418(-)